MPKLPPVKTKKIVSILVEMGFSKHHQIGSRAQFKHPDGRRTTIPVHQGKEIPRGTLQAIMQDIKVPSEDTKLNGYALTVNSITGCESNDQFSQPSEGNKYIVADITLENISNESKEYNPYNFSLQDDKSYSYQISFSNCKLPNLNSNTLQPSMDTRGFVTFEIPINSQPDKLIFFSL